MATSLQGANTKQAAASTRKRIIYQSEALFAGSSSSPQIINRVQSANYSFTVPRVDVNQYGQLGQIERIITEVPTVSLDFSYSLFSTDNEQQLFGTSSADSSGSRGVMYNINTSTAVEKQFYQLALSDEGTDYFGTGAGTNKCIIIEDGFLSSASWTGSVGDIPTASMNVESTKMKMGSAQGSPTASKETATTPRVLRPGNITFSASGAMSNSGGANTLPALGVDVLHVQSFTCNMDMPRESIQRLGDKFEFARLITFPLSATMSLEAIVSQQAADNLEEIVGTGDSTSEDPGFSIDINCGREGTSGVNGIKLRFKDAKVDGHSFSSSIGANKSVTLDFTVQVDSGSDSYGSGSAGFWLQQVT
jgi:hypothetical protein